MVQPVKGQIAYLEEILSDPAMSNVYFDLSWDEVAKYIVASDATVDGDGRPDQQVSRPLSVRHRRRRAEVSGAVFRRLRDVQAALGQADARDAGEKVLKGNYERLFDAARVKVRAWERANVPSVAGAR